MKSRFQVYIFPTPMGGYLIGLIFLMFLLSIGYSNNLLLIFTLFLFSLNLMWLIQSHIHLKTLKLHSISIEDGHVNEPILVNITWDKSPDGPWGWEVSFENDQDTIKMKSLDHKAENSLGEVLLPKRKLWEFRHFKVMTTMPFGLYRVWIYFPIECSVYAYPQRFKNFPPLQTDHSLLEGENTSSQKGFHDFWGLEKYQGEEARRINWKYYARSGELMIKEGQELTKSKIHFHLPKMLEDKEVILSQIASQMVHCSNFDIPFSLQTEKVKIGLGSNLSHLKKCLRELAQC